MPVVTASDLLLWTPLVSAASALAGAVVTFWFTARNLRAAQRHERAMRREAWERERLTAEREKRRAVFERFLMSVDATERAMAMLDAGRRSGRDIDHDPDITSAILGATAQHYEARSLLTLYAPPAVASAGVALSAHVNDFAAAARDFDGWKRAVYQSRHQYASAVQGALNAPPESTPTTTGRTAPTSPAPAAAG